MTPIVEPKLQELKKRLGRFTICTRASAVLGWDQTTYMPPGGAEARGTADRDAGAAGA